MESFSPLRLGTLLACVALLAGCHSGGGGGDTPTPPATFTVGGTLAGLAGGASVVLQNNGGANLTVSANGTYSFPAIASGSAYAVTVLTQPASQTCTVTNGSGTVSANVTNIAVNCVTNAPGTFTIGGTLSGLATGASVVLQNNAGSDLTVSANGNFTFTTQVNSGAAYAVSVLTQPSNPSQTCTVTNGSGTASTNVTNVAVDCVTNAPSTFPVGGTVTGLNPGGSVVLQNNAAAPDLTVSANVAFNFPAQASGTNYAVTVLTQPTNPGQTCTVTNGTGTVAGAAVTNVAVACVNTDQTAPTVTSRSPLPTAVGTKVQGGFITVTFSEAINPQSVDNNSFKLARPSGNLVAGEITFANGNTQAIFTPGTVALPVALQFDLTYTVTLTTAIRDLSNNPLAADVTWTFNTGKKLAASRHTCSRFVDGRVKCWGLNDHGQLGYDDTQTRGNGSQPFTNALPAVNLGAGRTAVAIAAGNYHTCAILENGETKCWGRNADGELGIGGNGSDVGDDPGDMANLVQPINFGGGRKAIEIAAEKYFSCARLDDNTVKCWGRNASGQLGQGNTTPLGVTPGDVATAPAINFGAGRTPIAISLAHDHACALLKKANGSNEVKCWGNNAWGQLGRGDTANIGDGANEMGDALTDIDFGAGLTATEVFAKAGFTCALLSNGAVKCWGLNTFGQLGLNAGNSQPPDFDSRLVCTGGPRDCIGDEPNEMGNALVAAIAGNVQRLAVGFRHTCALLTNGQLKCWGSNEEAQAGLENITGNNAIIGDQAGEMAALATTALKYPEIEELTGGAFHTCAWNTNDTLNCWGSNANAEVGHNQSNIDLLYGDEANEMGASMLDTDLGT